MNFDLIDKNNYYEFVEKIVDIFKLSSKTSSILFNMKISNYKVYIDLSIVDQSGEKKEYNEVIIDYDDSFYNNFLIPLVTKVNMFGNIVAKDIVNLDNDSLVTLRLISENNDLFTIDGLSKDDSSNLMKLLNDKKIDLIDD